MKVAVAVKKSRYAKDDREVPAPAVESDGYHLFLSHVWGTGQDQMRIVKQRLLEMLPSLKVGSQRCFPLQTSCHLNFALRL